MLAKLWWMIHKDLSSEWRARRAWPAMLLFGVVAALVLSLQAERVPHHRERLAGGLLWLATFFAGMLAIDRSLASEREEGCWEGLLAYPVAPAAVFAAKLAVNVIALGALQCVLIPLFVALCDAPLLARPGAMLLVAVSGNVGITAVGTLLGALTAGLRQGGSLLALVVLPLAIPVVLGASEATRLVAEGDLGAEWWRWLQLLAAFAMIYVTAGLLLFDFVIEE